MFNRKNQGRGRNAANWVGMEGLEDRVLMSAVAHFGRPGRALWIGEIASGTAAGLLAVKNASKLTVSQMTSDVQTGLTTLATNAGLTLDTTFPVRLSNVDGKALYSVVIKSAGTVTTLTVDATGAAYVPPTRTTTTFGAIANTAVTNEINAIAAALKVTAPTSTTTVGVLTTAGGASTYTVTLTSGKGKFKKGITISVDDQGNPVGNTTLPLSVLSTAVQGGLTTNAPAGANALAPSAPIIVRTLYGVTTYTAAYRGSGIHGLVTVDQTGALATTPSSSKTTYASVPSIVQNSLQTYATTLGASGTLDGTQKVNVFSLGNGTTLYTLKLSLTGTLSDGTTYEYDVAITVDQNGYLTVVPPGAPNYRS